MSMDLDSLAPQFKGMFESANLIPLYDEIGEILLSSIARNFRTGGRFGEKDAKGEWQGGSSKWLPSRRAQEQSGRTLQDRNILARSFSYRSDTTGVTVGSNLVYAAIHQYGGEAGKNRSVTLPPRPIVVVQPEDLDEITAAVQDYFARLLVRS